MSSTDKTVELNRSERRFVCVVGATGAMSLSLISCLPLAVTQIADGTANGSQSSVGYALGMELLLFAGIVFGQVLLRRPEARQRTMWASCLVSAAAFAMFAWQTSVFWLFAAALSAAPVGASTATIRTMLGRRFEKARATRAQSGVQVWLFWSLTSVMAGFSALAFTGQWRWGIGLIAAGLAAEGLFLVRWRPEVPSEQRGTAEQVPFRLLLRIYPAIAMSVAVGTVYAAYGLFAVKAQPELVVVGYEDRTATVLALVMGALRVPSVYVTKRVQQISDDSMRSAARCCGGLAVAAAILAMLAARDVGWIATATLMVLAAFGIEVAMNSLTPVTRTYITELSPQLATLVTLMASVFSGAAGFVAGQVTWTQAMVVVAGLLAVTVGLLRAADRSSYAKSESPLSPPMPAARSLEVRVDAESRAGNWLVSPHLRWDAADPLPLMPRAKQPRRGDKVWLDTPLPRSPDSSDRDGREFWPHWGWLEFVEPGPTPSPDSRRVRATLWLRAQAIRREISMADAMRTAVLAVSAESCLLRRADGSRQLSGDAVSPRVVASGRVRAIGGKVPIVDTQGECVVAWLDAAGGDWRWIVQARPETVGVCAADPDLSRADGADAVRAEQFTGLQLEVVTRYTAADSRGIPPLHVKFSAPHW